MTKLPPNKENLDLIFLIDRSGSMYGSEEDTLGGFNSFIDKEKSKGESTTVTTILFDHDYELLYKRKPIDEVDNLTKDVYYVRGSTALLDAIGKTITTMDREIDNKVLFVIMTDGMENSSVEFSKSQIKNMIESHSWEFIFIGADIDSYSEGSNIGIKRSRIATHSKSRRGFEDAYHSIDNALYCLRENRSLDDGMWKEDLKKYD